MISLTSLMLPAFVIAMIYLIVFDNLDQFFDEWRWTLRNFFWRPSGARVMSVFLFSLGIMLLSCSVLRYQVINIYGKQMEDILSAGILLPLIGGIAYAIHFFGDRAR